MKCDASIGHRTTRQNMEKAENGLRRIHSAKSVFGLLHILPCRSVPSTVANLRQFSLCKFQAGLDSPLGTTWDILGNTLVNHLSDI